MRIPPGPEAAGEGGDPAGAGGGGAGGGGGDTKLGGGGAEAYLGGGGAGVPGTVDEHPGSGEIEQYVPQ